MKIPILGLDQIEEKTKEQFKLKKGVKLSKTCSIKTFEGTSNKLSNATHVGTHEVVGKKAPVTKTPLTKRNGKTQSDQQGNPETLRIKAAVENKDPLKINNKKTELVPKKKAEKKEGKT